MIIETRPDTWVMHCQICQQPAQIAGRNPGHAARMALGEGFRSVHLVGERSTGHYWACARCALLNPPAELPSGRGIRVRSLAELSGSPCRARVDRDGPTLPFPRLNEAL